MATPMPTPQHGINKAMVGEKRLKDYQPYFEEIKRTHPEWIFVDSPRCKVFRLNTSVIKFGLGVDSREAQAMRLIKQSTSIPVPNIIAEAPHLIVMEYVDGDNLQRCWAEFTDLQRQRVAEQMCEILQQLQKLKGAYIGGVNQGPAVDARKSVYVGGPFDSESEFNQFLLGNMIRTTPKLYRDALQQKLRSDHRLVFTHADLNLHNILVKNGNIVALLDWECAGWYPEHWEYVKFCKASCHDHTWHKLGRILFPTTYHDELITDQFYSLFVF